MASESLTDKNAVAFSGRKSFFTMKVVENSASNNQVESNGVEQLESSIVISMSNDNQHSSHQDKKTHLMPSCWVKHTSLDNEMGLDPSGIRIKPISGLVAADYFAPGHFVWDVLIANLARVGYEETNVYMVEYLVASDWFKYHCYKIAIQENCSFGYEEKRLTIFYAF
ncbi:hypothetical protein L1987_24767 [Smallanthus sonchifolius]|uniref:Uncharacterized protein n=1 Tax=Smallanthus sonchifolius TaxID=185202 RepID=A0ACB9ILY4_9ASTR|nr:hypothetical protein L1987_24767 [Smallanthus sonchifolius]